MKNVRYAVVLFVLALPFLYLTWVGLSAKNADLRPVVITGYDPRDMLRGQYVQFSYVWDDPDSVKPEGVVDDNLPETGRFYVTEEDGPILDQILRITTTDKIQNRILYKIVNAEVTPESLLINDKPYKDILDCMINTNQYASYTQEQLIKICIAE